MSVDCELLRSTIANLAGDVIPHLEEAVDDAEAEYDAATDAAQGAYDAMLRGAVMSLLLNDHTAWDATKANWDEKNAAKKAAGEHLDDAEDRLNDAKRELTNARSNYSQHCS